MKNVNVYNVKVLNDYDVDNETTEYVNVMKTLVQTVQNARHELTYLNVINENNDETLTFVLYNTGEQQDNEDYEFDYHYDSDKPTNLGDGLSISKCPYCGGRYVNDINDGSSYCMDCGIGIEE